MHTNTLSSPNPKSVDLNLVLLVDDDDVARFLWKKVIESSDTDVEVKECFNGLEALNFLKTNWNQPLLLPDIIFLDLNMPVMNGLTFLDEFMALNENSDKKIKIYVLSSSIIPSEIEEVKNRQAVSGFINKPLKKEKFEKVLESLNNHC
jgi:CheY-like chemotaxis protein